MYNPFQLFIPPINPMAMAYNPMHFGCMPLPFFQNHSIPNFNYPFFMPPEQLFPTQQQPIPIMINNQLELQ